MPEAKDGRKQLKFFEEAFRLSGPRSAKDVQIMLAISHRESGNYRRALELLTEIQEKGIKLLFFI